MPHVETDDGTTRDAMSVDGTQPPKLGFTVVGIGASAGGLEAFTEFFDAMPPDKGMAFVLVQHLSPKRESMIAELLQKHTQMPVLQVDDGMLVEPDHVYVIRPGHTMTIKDGRLHLGESLLKPGHSRPVDDFFRSLAEEQRERAVGIILSGMGSNGTAGAQAIKVVGGVCIAQEPDSAKFPSMPRSLIDANLADFILRAQEIPEALLRYSQHTYVSGNRSTELLARRESQQIGEILAILRARVRHDFTGYKKPTVVRRIQRRMSLTQHSVMAEYARMLRQTPAEVTNLSDDLMIHVTGFFRDPEVWEGLREKIILPMVAERQDQATLRCWVTACASGEEAYTLAMLLVEAAEQVDKRFDIKVFATDMAERALVHARAGIFPGGIESEISSERLVRFFDREDGVYRVKKELRERVVFAPQNVLQDPPFSRLDIVTCRNLMIYLEPEMQQRVLGLLHFGLREGGTLVLGNSETIGDRADLFEVIDKKLRLYRRIGASRHGSIDFPVPPVLLRSAGGPESDEPRVVSRASLTQVANKLLLDTYTPPAVVVDRHGRIVFFHGDTELYLDQPRGEPTREVLILARDSLRGTIRVALNQAIDTNVASVVKDGLKEIDGTQFRIEITAAPMDRRGVPGYYLISFNRYPVSLVPVTLDSNTTDAEMAEELRTVRDELQSTIEELQTSNEELKASNEEITSINEELQSSNEELETSKEELQSLNEELTTVNAQLQTKMEDLDRTGNDLGSLLSSTDIAVIFLDTQFRIRRFTPATKRLMDLIPGDTGRPLADLARRFDDPKLLEDSAAVLDTLRPAAAEVRGDNGRWYSRHVLPYRTAGNRIEGVVITFVDITDRRTAERLVRESEKQLQALLTISTESPYRMSADWSNMLTLEGNDFLPDTIAPRQSWLERYIPKEDRPTVTAAIEQAIVGKRIFSLEHRVRRADGSIGWTFSRAVPVLNETGELVEWFGIASDITARKQAELALRESEERQAFLLRLSDAIRTLSDPLSIETEACRLLGEHLRVDRAYYMAIDETNGEAHVRGDYFSGQSPSLAGRHRIADFGWVIPRMRRGDVLVMPDVANSTFVSDADRPAMKAMQIGAHVNAPLVKGGRLVGAVCVTESGARAWQMSEVELVREAAERVWSAAERARAEEASRESETRLRLALDAAEMGAYAWYPAEDRTEADPKLLELFGLPPNGAITHVGAMADLVHPDDREHHEAVVQQALDPTGDGIFRDEIRVRPNGGTVRWVAVSGRVTFEGAPPRPVRLSGVARNVTARHQSDTALRESETRYAALTANLPQGAAFVVGTDLRYTLAEGQALRDAGLTPADFVGKTLAEAVTPEVAAEYERNYRAALAGETFRYEHAAHGRNFITHGGPLRDADGNIYAAMAVSYDITDRKQAEAERLTLLNAEQYARTAAETANASKDLFLANLSHELRTPLSAMLIWSRVLQEQPDASTMAEGLASIEQSAKAQQKLIDDLLDSARIATGKLSLELKPVDLGKVVRDAAAALRHTVDAKGLELQLDIGKTIGTVMADADRLQQVVWNLISNAVKFTPSGGRVDVGVWRRDGSVEIRVADTGQGIDVELLPHVFGRFRQGDPSRTRRQGGLGLGLSISRQIVELHGGTIAVTSDGPGQGSVFTIFLPLPKTKSTKRPPAANENLKGTRIVLVEDDVQLRDVVTMLLERDNAEVKGFGMADPAKAAILAETPDVLLCDIGLPDKDGYALIRELREQERPGTRLPAIAFTAFDRPQDREHAIACGFDDHLAKPVDPSKLVQTIRTLLNR